MHVAAAAAAAAAAAFEQSNYYFAAWQTLIVRRDTDRPALKYGLCPCFVRGKGNDSVYCL